MRARSVFGHSGRPGPWMNPYLAGVGIGTVLLASFVVMGRGLGASGAFSSAAAAAMSAISPARAGGLEPYAAFLGSPRLGPLSDWLVVELVGVALGAAISAWWAGRTRFAVERGAGITIRRRLVLAFLAGVLMAVGAAFARGCTSGQALSGGSLLAVGSWIFILAAFSAGFASAPLFGRVWR